MTRPASQLVAVVQRDKPEIYRILKEHPDLATVVLDRRVGERRRTSQLVAIERRRVERRQPLPGAWTTQGFVLVPIKAPQKPKLEATRALTPSAAVRPPDKPISRRRPAPAPRRTFRVLFVCTANICRSRMAEEIFQELTAGDEIAYEVRSAGTYSDVTGRQLTKQDVQWADVVCVMEPTHEAYIAERWGALPAQKVRVLGIPDIFNPGNPALKELLVTHIRELLAKRAQLGERVTAPRR